MAIFNSLWYVYQRQPQHRGVVGGLVCTVGFLGVGAVYLGHPSGLEIGGFSWGKMTGTPHFWWAKSGDDCCSLRCSAQLK